LYRFFDMVHDCFKEWHFTTFNRDEIVRARSIPAPRDRPLSSYYNGL